MGRGGGGGGRSNPKRGGGGGGGATATAEGPARMFDFGREAHAWGEAAFADWAASLTRAEVEALKYYTDSGYGELNAYLRTGDDPMRFLNVFEKTAARLDAALAKARTPEAVVTFRGVEGLDRIFTDGIRVGTTFSDKGFGSTSLDRKVASDFSGGRYALENDGVLRIRVPKGARAAYVDFEHVTGTSGERELLLPRNSRFRVRKVSSAPNGSRVIDVDLL